MRHRSINPLPIVVGAVVTSPSLCVDAVRAPGSRVECPRSVAQLLGEHRLELLDANVEVPEVLTGAEEHDAIPDTGAGELL